MAGRIASTSRALQGVKYGDKYYAVPTEITTAGIYYNKSIFQEAGIEPAEVPTWDEFLGYCEKIKAAGYQAPCLGNKDGGKAQWWWDYAVVRENGNDYRRQLVRGEIPLNDKGVIAALERTQADIFTNGNMNDDVNGLDIFGWLGMMAEGQDGHDADPLIPAATAHRGDDGRALRVGFFPSIRKCTRAFPSPTTCTWRATSA